MFCRWLSYLIQLLQYFEFGTMHVRVTQIRIHGRFVIRANFIRVNGRLDKWIRVNGR